VEDFAITEFEYLDPDRVDAVHGPANGTPFLMLKSLEEDGELDDGVVKFVSAEARRKYAASGVAMSDGAFPIADEGHLKSAIGRLGNYKGSRGKAKRHIIKRAKALGLTHMLPKDWRVSKALTASQTDVQSRELAGSPDDSLGQTRENGDDEIVHEDVQNDAGKPGSEHYSQPRPNEHTGYGDTSPEKTLPETEALSQTREESATKNAIGPNEASSEGTLAPRRKRDTKRAEREGQSQTVENHEGESEVDPNADQMELEATQTQKRKKHLSMKNPAKATGANPDTDPGNPAWQDKDVELASEAVAHLREALNLAGQFESREKREAKKATKRINAAVRSFATVSTVAKEIEDMTTEELLKLLDDRDRAKAQKAEKAAKKEAKRAAKATAKMAKAAEAPEDGELAKRVMALENTPVRRAAMNDAGLRPVFRGTPPAGLEAVQKALDAASTPQERTALKQEMIKAKFLGNNSIQVPQDENGNALPHGPVALISQPPEAFANARAAMGRR
jgi:hypothetical protein